MKYTPPWLSNMLYGVPLKEYHVQEERSPLELTEREQQIVKKTIRRLGILFAIERMILVLLVVGLVLFAVLFLFSLIA